MCSRLVFPSYENLEEIHLLLLLYEIEEHEIERQRVMDSCVEYQKHNAKRHKTFIQAKNQCISSILCIWVKVNEQIESVNQHVQLQGFVGANIGTFYVKCLIE